jgi:hypothetical protein
MHVGIRPSDNNVRSDGEQNKPAITVNVRVHLRIQLLIDLQFRTTVLASRLRTAVVISAQL